MTNILLSFAGALLSSVKTRLQLVLENLVLRQQLAVLKRSVKRPKITATDRAFWSLLFRWWSRWRDALVIVRPATVVAWHRKGFRLFWRWKSRSRGGRPRVADEIRALVRQMARANVGWGAPRIHGELLKLGFEVSQTTVSRYMPERRGPPSQTWRSFLDNHVGSLASIDFFVVPTATFRLLFGFVVLLHQRRRVAHFNVTANPTAQWTAQQIVEAFPEDTAPSYMIRDRDSIYGADFVARIGKCQRLWDTSSSNSV